VSTCRCKNKKGYQVSEKEKEQEKNILNGPAKVVCILLFAHHLVTEFGSRIYLWLLERSEWESEWRKVSDRPRTKEKDERTKEKDERTKEKYEREKEKEKGQRERKSEKDESAQGREREREKREREKRERENGNERLVLASTFDSYFECNNKLHLQYVKFLQVQQLMK
jgi:hypothetical protein